MTKIITQAKIELCKALHKQGCSYRAIAKRADVSRETVRIIVAGKYDGSKIPEPTPPKYRNLYLPKRCKGCGGLVKIEPCLTCEIQKYVEEDEDTAEFHRQTRLVN